MLEHLQCKKEEGKGGAHDVILGQHQHVWLPAQAAGGGKEVIFTRVAMKIFEDFRGALSKEFIIGQEPVSIIHYT